MKELARILFLSGLIVVTGCSPTTTKEAEGTTTAAESGDDPGNAWVSLGPTDNYGIVAVTLSKRFFDGTKDDCGGDYSVDAQIDVGRVTDDSIEVKTVTYIYHPNQYSQAPDSFIDASSNGTSGYTIYQTGGHAEGDTIFSTFEVNRVYEGVRADGGAGLIVHQRTHLALGDQYDICGLTMKIVLQT